MALGAGETTVMRMVTGYSMLANGGKQHQGDADRPHPGPLGPAPSTATTSASAWAATRRNGTSQNEPKLIDKREQVLDPLTAYQITSIMEGVIQRGTGAVDQGGRQASRRQDRHHQRRQGSVVRRLLARSRRRRLHRLRPAALARRFQAQAATYAAPIFRDFMMVALKDKPDVPFRVPPGIKLISVDAHSGLRASGAGSILEAFKPGTAPPDSYSAAAPTPACAPRRAGCRQAGRREWHRRAVLSGAGAL